GQGEEAFAGQGHVQRLAGVVDVALGELLGHALQAHAGADGVVGQAVRRGGEHVAELAARLLEAGAVGVGDVVGSDVEVGRGCVHAAQRDQETHGVLLGRKVRAGRTAWRQPMRWTAESGTLPMPARLRNRPPGSIDTLSTRALARMGSRLASLADGSAAPVTARKL